MMVSSVILVFDHQGPASWLKFKNEILVSVLSTALPSLKKMLDRRVAARVC